MVKIFKAYADETRLKIVKLLLSKQAKGGLCVCQILNALQMKQAAVSKALNVLKNAGVVTDIKKGMWVYYSISDTNQTKDINIIIKKELGSDTIAIKTAGAIKSPQACCDSKRCK
ncbi:MAG: ArsR family transcriptional regulator [Candidatus Goldiibacteriota bacterium HGW-Goldbacteria-1]|jgi:DNA-binding transcriptional ArsR family regulator|nr:MAG: ArsR family transcriptional regulator [Candidatus Goldiibacteriota bacterium HGW-Goldbacteria-1]